MSQSSLPAIAPLTIALVTMNVTTTIDTAFADEPDRQRAKEAYAAGTTHFDAGAFDEAARAYLEADALAPSDAALEATFAALSRGNPTSNLTLTFCRRVEERITPPREISTYRASCDARGATFGSFILDCDGTCTGRIEARSFGEGVPVVAIPGSVVLDVESGGARASRTVSVAAHSRTIVRVAAPPLPDPATSPSNRGVSPAWFGVAIGATAALGAATIVSGVDTSNAHDDFDAMKCGSVSAARPAATQAECHEARDDGESAALRTNILLGVTAASAVGTLVFALTAVDFGDGASVSFIASPEVAAASVRFRFE